MTLELQTGMTKDEITGITCLLRSSPILHTIILSVKGFSKTGNESWNDKQYWKSQIQNLKSIELHLKVARIDVEDFNMHKRAVYLVKLLLRHGRALQEMTLTLRSKRVVPPFKRRRIHSQILKFKRASSNVIIYFLFNGDPV